MKNCICLWLFALLPCFAQSNGEKQPANSEWWISPKDAPLSLAVSRGGRYLDLFNVSHYVVISHTLGCVVEEKGEFRLTKVLAERTRTFNPGDGLSELKQSYKSRYYDNCTHPASKLAIVKVTFADGKSWILATSRKTTERVP
jgi:hypothetical protein